MISRFWRAFGAVLFFAASIATPRVFAQANDAKPAAAPVKKSPWKPEDVIFQILLADFGFRRMGNG